MHKKLIALLIFMAVAPACIHANPVAPCGSGVTLQSVILTTCTIGDKTFSFTAVTSLELSTGFMTFTTDTSNPNSPGFIIAPAAGSAFSATNGDFDIALFYTVTITNPASGFMITGQASKLNGVTATPTSSANSFLIQSINDVCQGFSDAILDEENGVIIANGPTSSQPCIPTTSASGQAALLIDVGGGTGSVTSAAYYINETGPAAPEPASLLLLGTGLSAIGYGARRKWLRNAFRHRAQR